MSRKRVVLVVYDTLRSGAKRMCVVVADHLGATQANQIYQMAQMMIKVKRAQLRAEAASRGGKSDGTDHKKKR